MKTWFEFKIKEQENRLFIMNNTVKELDKRLNIFIKGVNTILENDNEKSK